MIEIRRIRIDGQSKEIPGTRIKDTAKLEDMRNKE